MRFQWYSQTRSVQRFSNTNRAWSGRASTLVVARDIRGTYGIGEATPLPGYSPDSIIDVERWLRATDSRRWYIDGTMPFDVVSSQLDAATVGAPPSACLAVHTALLDLWSKQRGTTLTTELCAALSAYARYSPDSADVDGTATNREPPFPVAPLLDVHSPALEQLFTDWVAQGFATFKVKVGTNLAHEAQALHKVWAIARAAGHAVTFRLDANQSLKADALAAALTPFAHLPIAYIEEPCALNQLTATQSLPLPLALDESLQLGQATLAHWLKPGRLAALVCKPMVVGGLRSVLSWNSQSSQLPCDFVLSHLFDGPIAFQLYRALALALAPRTCHGLYPHAGLELWSDWVDEAPGHGVGLALTPFALEMLTSSGGPSR